MKKELWVVALTNVTFQLSWKHRLLSEHKCFYYICFSTLRCDEKINGTWNKAIWANKGAILMAKILSPVAQKMAENAFQGPQNYATRDRCIALQEWSKRIIKGTSSRCLFYPLKRLKRFSHQFNFKNNGPVLLFKTIFDYFFIETVSCRLL